MSEEILEPDLPIIDPHHHLWDLRPLVGAFPEPLHPFIASIALSSYYTFNELHADATSGHNVIGTVFMECGAFYRAGADDAFKVVGEVEYVNGVAAQSASGLYGDIRLCDAIIGHADLRLGAKAGDVLDALMAASPRFKGIRHQGAWDADPEVLGPPFHAPPGLYNDAAFREGFAELVMALARNNIAWGVVTTTSRSNVDALLRRHLGRQWTEAFAAIVCGGNIDALLVGPPEGEEEVSEADLDNAITEALADMPASKAASEVAKRFNLNRSDVYQRILARRQGDGE